MKNLYGIVILLSLLLLFAGRSHDIIQASLDGILRAINREAAESSEAAA